MCGRYANHVGAMHGWADILETWPEQLELGFNVAPTQNIPVFLNETGQVMRWGLIPPWSADINSRYSTFNARLGTAHEKPSFRHAWSQGQRCLIPALGYYEWRQEEQCKQAYFVVRSDGAPIVFGGLYEPGREDGIPASCTILTRPAKGEFAELHHAMPVMLDPEYAECWLQGSAVDSSRIAWRDYDDKSFSYYAVSNAVNSVRNQGPQLIHASEKNGDQQQGFSF